MDSYLDHSFVSLTGNRFLAEFLRCDHIEEDIAGGSTRSLNILPSLITEYPIDNTETVFITTIVMKTHLEILVEV